MNRCRGTDGSRLGAIRADPATTASPCCTMAKCFARETPAAPVASQYAKGLGMRKPMHRRIGWVAGACAIVLLPGMVNAGSSNLEGSVKGNDVQFTVKRETSRGEFEMNYRGKVDGDTMKGSAQARHFDIDWAAKRRK